MQFQRNDKEGQLLRIFIGEADRYEGRPLYEWIVLTAQARGLAGATVYRGIMGFGAKSRIHTSRIMRLSEDLPVVVEIVDLEENLKPFLKLLEGVVTEGLMTFERAQIHFYRSDRFFRSDRKPV